MIYFDHSRLQFWCICSHPLCQARQREKAPLRKKHLITTYFILYLPLPGVHTFFGANPVISGAFAEWNKAVDDVMPLRCGAVWTWKHLYPEWRGGRARLTPLWLIKVFHLQCNWACRDENGPNSGSAWSFVKSCSNSDLTSVWDYCVEPSIKPYQAVRRHMPQGRYPHLRHECTACISVGFWIRFVAFSHSLALPCYHTAASSAMLVGTQAGGSSREPGSQHPNGRLKGALTWQCQQFCLETGKQHIQRQLCGCVDHPPPVLNMQEGSDITLCDACFQLAETLVVTMSDFYRQLCWGFVSKQLAKLSPHFKNVSGGFRSVMNEDFVWLYVCIIRLSPAHGTCPVCTYFCGLPVENTTNE